MNAIDEVARLETSSTTGNKLRGKSPETFDLAEDKHWDKLDEAEAVFNNAVTALQHSPFDDPVCTHLSEIHI